LADWVGHAAWWVVPLAELIGAQVMAASIIHTDDTPIAGPGAGQRQDPNRAAVGLCRRRAAVAG